MSVNQKINLSEDGKDTTNQSKSRSNLVENFRKFQKEREKQAEIEKQELEIKKKEFQEELDREREFKKTLKEIKNHNSLANLPKKSVRNNSSKEKSSLNIKSSYDIEVFKKVKSNTALASAALFLATGVLLAEAKEEMKWVKTQLFIKDDGIKIRNPSLSHKFSDFRYFKVNQEDEYYLFFIGFDDENLIHFRTKENYLHEVIMEKIQETNLQYESVL